MADYCIAYHSKTGTARDIGARIAEYLNQHDVSTELKPLEELNDPGSYRGIILGGPINGMNMAAAFRQELARLEGSLPAVLGVYAASIVFNHGRTKWVKIIRKNVSSLAAEFGTDRWMVPGGRTDRPMPGFARWIFGLPKTMPLDTVNWLTVINWSQEILGDIREAAEH
jgi:flavodoxin